MCRVESPVIVASALAASAFAALENAAVANAVSTVRKSSLHRAPIPSPILVHQAKVGDLGVELHLVVRGWPRPALHLFKDDIPIVQDACEWSGFTDLNFRLNSLISPNLISSLSSKSSSQTPLIVIQEIGNNFSQNLSRSSSIRGIRSRSNSHVSIVDQDHAKSRQFLVTVRFVQPLSVIDSGVYRLRASNRLGHHDSSIRLQIDSPFLESPRLPLVTRHSDGVYLIEWLASVDANITGYRLETRWPYETSWHVFANVPASSTTYWCQLLSDKSDEPLFRVRAYNELNQLSEPTEPVTAISRGKDTKSENTELKDSYNLLSDSVFYRNIRNLALPKKFSDRFDICQSLGERDYIRLYRLLDTESGRYYLGRLTQFDDGERQNQWRRYWFEQEKNLRGLLTHSAIINAQDYYQDRNRLMQVLQMVQGRCFYDELNRNLDFAEREIADISQQLCELLRHLHSRNFVYFGLEPENLFFNEQQRYSPEFSHLSSNLSDNDADLDEEFVNRIKVVDLGQVYRLPKRTHDVYDEREYQNLHSPNNIRLLYRNFQYIPPEIYSHSEKKVGTSGDMWSLGMLLYRLASGKLPWLDKSMTEIKSILQDSRNRRLQWSQQEHFPLPKNISPEMSSFIHSLLQLDPALRPSACQALSHPWFMRRKQLTMPSTSAFNFSSDNNLLGLRHRLVNWPLVLEQASTHHEEIGDLDTPYGKHTMISANLTSRGSAPIKLLSGLINLQGIAESSNASFSIKVMDLKEEVSQVEWFFNNRSILLLDLKNTGKISIKSLRYSCFCDLEANIITLVINSVNAMDSGTYSVVLTNIDGTLQTMDSAMLRIKEPPTCRRKSFESGDMPDLRAKIVTPLIDQCAIFGEIITIKAIISGIPQPKITWEHSGNILESSIKYRINYDTESNWAILQIMRSSASDSGLYTLRVKNRNGSDDSSMYLTLIDLKDENHKRLPQFSHSLSENKRIIEGDSFELKCRAEVDSDDVPPQIRWLKNRRPLMHSSLDELNLTINDCEDRDSSTNRLGVSTKIKTPSARIEHNGLYTCVASSDVGSTYSETLLSVQKLAIRRSVDRIMPVATVRAPEFLQRPRTKEFSLYDVNGRRVTEDIVITCCVLGTPTPEVVWSKDKCAIPHMSGKHSAKNLGGHYYELRIRDPNADDAGIYEALAFNKGGECRCQCTVTLKDDVDFKLPKFLKQLTITNVKEGQRLEISCAANGKPTPQFQWEKDSVIILSDSPGEPHFIIDSDGQTETSLTIKKCTRQDEGLYQCTAFNKYGRTKTSAFIRVESSGAAFKKSSYERSYSSSTTTSTTTSSVVSNLPPTGFAQRQTSQTTSTSASYQFKGVATSQEPNSSGILILEQPPRTLKVEENQPLELNFLIKCSAYYRAIWTKRGRTLTYDSRHQIMRNLDTGLHQLRIESCSSMDGGKYTLEIDCESLLGSSSENNPMIIPINVEVLPAPPNSQRSPSVARRYSSTKESYHSTSYRSYSRSITPKKA